MESEKLTTQTILNVVQKLTGNVYPLGDASRDKNRLYNLKTLSAVTESLIGIIHDIAQEYEHSQLGSIQTIQKQAAKFLQNNRIPLAFYEEDAIEDLGMYLENNFKELPKSASEDIFNFLKDKGYIIT